MEEEKTENCFKPTTIDSLYQPSTGLGKIKLISQKLSSTVCQLGTADPFLIVMV